MTTRTTIRACGPVSTMASVAPASGFPLETGPSTHDAAVLLRRQNFRLTPTEALTANTDIPSWMARPRCPGSFRRTL
jgi:hypothetical protein